MLVPVTPSISIVAKLAAKDPDAGDVLAQFAIYEALCLLVDQDGERIAKLADDLIDRRSDNARRDLVRQYCSKRLNGEDVEPVLKAAAALTTIDVAVSKALFNRYEESKHRRDPATGRWVAVLPNSKNPEHSHRMAANQISNWMSSKFISPGTPIILGGLNKNGESVRARYDTHSVDHKVIRDDMEKIGLRPYTVEVHESHVNAPTAANSRAVYDLMNGAIGPQNAAHLARNAPLGPGENGSFRRELDNVVRQSTEGDRRAYRQINAAGRALTTVSRPGSTGYAVGGLAQLAGTLGPQAEAVLSPGIKRTAYRYRGTERTPDARLVREVQSASAGASAISAGAKATADGSLWRGTAQYYSEEGLGRRMPPDQVRLLMAGDTATGYFINKIPDPQKAELSIEAGRVPPSQGAIIDRTGNVVSEAMGYGSDHYLPFDLKNLKRLDGGQYVRTRVSGGPTTEDVYTGLMTGARQIQIASNSGVFTVEFDPSLRGGRKFSDKARQMIGRYQAILDRIEVSQQGGGKEIYTNDLPAAEQAAITRQAYERAGYDPVIGEGYARTDLAEARQRARFATPTDDELEEAARNKVMTDYGRTGQLVGLTDPKFKVAVADEFNAQLKAHRDKRITQLQLDGEGYYRALQSLQEEFPYFIRNVDYRPLRPFTLERRHEERGILSRVGTPRARDRGYVRPNQLKSVTTSGHRLSNERERTDSAREETEESGASGATGRTGRIGETARTVMRPTAQQLSSSGDLRPFKPEPSADNSREIEDKLGKSGARISNFMGQRLADVDPSKSPDDLVGPQHDAGEWIKTYAEKNGGWPTAMRKLAKSGTKAELKQALAAADIASGLIESDQEALAVTPSNTREMENISEFREALLELKGLRFGMNKDVGSDIALYKPDDDDSDTPAYFKEIDELGTNPANYAGFLSKQDGTKFKAAYDSLVDEGNEERGVIVADMVSNFQRAQDWGKGASNVPKPAQLPTGVAGHADASPRVLGPGHPAHKELLAYQQAWAFLNQRDAIGGGEPIPKEEEEATKSLRGQRRVIVHPPGSRVSKAMVAKRAMAI